MRHAPITPQIQVPLKRFLRQIMFAQTPHQRVVICQTLAAADNFAVPFRSNHVETQRKFRSRRIRRHVKRLHRRGITVNHHRPVEFLGNDRFLVATEVIAPFCRIPSLLQHFDRVVVGDQRKGRADFLQRSDVPFDQPQLSRAVFRYRLHHRAHQTFSEHNHVLEMRVRSLRLQHPEFGQVPPRLRFLRAKSGSERIDLAQRGRQRLHVKLARLRQISLLFVNVIHLKQRGGSFARRRSENRRVGQRVTLRVHEIPRRALGLGANAQDRRLSRRANPQMPPVQQKINAVLLQLNRVRFGIPNALHNFDRAHSHFISARRSRFRANHARRDHARFLRQPLQRAENLGMLLLRNHSLHDARTVAKNRKQQFPRFAQIVKPAPNSDATTRVRPRLLNCDNWNCCLCFLGHVVFPLDYLPRTIMACTSWPLLHAMTFGISRAPYFCASNFSSHLSQASRICSSEGPAAPACALISKTNGSSTDALANPASAASQSIVPSNGSRCSSLSNGLSWLWVLTTRSRSASKLACTPSSMCPWPMSKLNFKSCKCVSVMKCSSEAGALS